MSPVLDASALGPYLLADEGEHLLPGLADVLTDSGVIVPAHWHVEIANLLLVAARRGRLDETSRVHAFSMVASAMITTDEQTGPEALLRIWTLAEAHRLTIYDACYLELAMRMATPLATNDRALAQAAKAEAVRLFGR